MKYWHTHKRQGLSEICNLFTAVCSSLKVFLESDDDVFLESETETTVPETKQPRNYAKRRSGPLLFLGLEVCVHAFQHLLGVGSSTLHRLRHDGKAFTRNRKEKTVNVKHPHFGFSLDRGSKWISVVMFLWVLYHSSGEVLPTTLSMPNDARSEMPFPKEPDTDFTERSVSKFMASIQNHGHDIDVMTIGPGTFAGPKRHIQHTTRSETYHLLMLICLWCVMLLFDLLRGFARLFELAKGNLFEAQLRSTRRCSD